MEKFGKVLSAEPFFAEFFLLNAINIQCLKLKFSNLKMTIVRIFRYVHEW